MKTKFKTAFMDVASTFAKLSSARRLQVGAIVVKDERIISIGYNGMPSGWDNECERVEFVGDNEQLESPDKMMKLGFTRSNVGWVRTTTKPEVLHAEMNALMKLARSNESGLDSTLFVTHAPCLDCAKGIYQAGIKEVYYAESYRSTAGIEFLIKCGISVEQIKKQSETYGSKGQGKRYKKVTKRNTYLQEYKNAKLT